MNQTVTQSLSELGQRYVFAWKEIKGSLPVSEEMVGLASPCIINESAHAVEWQPVHREESANFSNVEEGMDILIHPDCIEFYCSQFSADMQASFDSNVVTLLQVWSDEDLVRLQQNLIGHLVTQRRLKLKPTLFIATTDEELEVISICNISGEVILEKLGTKQRKVLSENLCQFLNKLKPVVAA